MILKETPFHCLLALLFLKALLIVGIIFYAQIPLGPEEAQYWCWSQDLSWGYYSKPPGIAWEIWTGCQLFGNTEFGVRFGAIILAFFSAIFVYCTAKACRLQPWTAFFAGAIMALSPLGMLGSFLAVTDGGLVLFWTLASYLMAKAITEKQSPNFLLIGVVIFFGALFKWPIYVFWLFVLGFFPYYPRASKTKLLIGIAISLFGLLPSFIWNYEHDWVTFRHVQSTMLGQQVGIKALKGNFGDFLAMQAGILSPLLFLTLIIGFFFLIFQGRKIQRSLVFCGSVTLSLIVLYSYFSLSQKIQGNWCVFAYPTGIVFLAWFACEKLSLGKLMLICGIALALFQNTLMFGIPYVQANSLMNIPYRYNFFRHHMGWQELEKHIIALPQEQFLFSDKYQMSSILSFYSPEQNRAYFLNIQQNRLNQFSFWPSMAEEQIGSTGYFIVAENQPYLKQWNQSFINAYQEQLAPYFDQIEIIGIKPIFTSFDRVEKSALFLKCTGYNGKQPPKTQQY